MWGDLLAIAGLGALCGTWVVVQRFVERHNPGRGHPTGGCGSCSGHCETPDDCETAPSPTLPEGPQGHASQADAAPPRRLTVVNARPGTDH